MKPALLLIDLQNDYFPGGLFPLWNTDAVLGRTLKAIEAAKTERMPIIHIRHIADPDAGIAPFFNKDTEGTAIHADILAAAPHSPIVIKSFADSFHMTALKALLYQEGITDLLIAGMMTQNCVTHTAISQSAEDYEVTVLTDCCTTVSEPIHQIALHALSTRVNLATAADVLPLPPEAA